MKTILKAFFFICVLLASNMVYSQTIYKGPLGGGYDYEGVIESSNVAFIQCSTYQQLKTTVENFSAQDFTTKNVYLTNDITIPSGSSITINTNNLTLASGRGSKNSYSAKITKPYRDGVPAISVISGINNRITGLIIAGPDMYNVATDGGNCGIKVSGINHSMVVKNFTVDNCEIYGWPIAGIEFGYEGLIFDPIYITNNYIQNSNTTTETAYIHHNYIHHTCQDGWGYGVCVNGDSYAKISNNIFDYFRHAVTSQGTKFTSYEVDNNLILANGTDNSAAIETHGYLDIYRQIYQYRYNDLYLPYQNYLPNLCNNGQWHSTSNYASQSLIITNNTFVYKGERYNASSNDYNFPIDISGIPYQSCIISNNIFAGQSNRSIAQTFSWEVPGIITCQDRAISNFIGIDAYNNTYSANISLKYMSWQGTQEWAIVAPEMNYLVGSGKIVSGNFIGDKSYELFKGDGANWNISRRGYLPWENYCSSGYSTTQLKFKDINGDKYTDVLVSNGSCKWLHSDGGFNGTTGWMPTNYVNCSVVNDSFKDFDGDGVNDQFRATGTIWEYYSSRAIPKQWILLGSSGYLANELLFGDFDGNGITDIMYIGSAPAANVNYWIRTTQARVISTNKNINNEPILNNKLDKELKTIQIFPNPVKDLLTFSTKGESIQSITFINSLGEIIKSITTNNENITIDCQDLATGIYVIKIKCDANIYYDKILKVK